VEATLVPPGVTRFLGYKKDMAPASVARVRAALVKKQGSADFADLAPRAVAKAATVAAGVTVVLNNVVKKQSGSFLPSQYQNRGTCTSRGAKRVFDLLQYAQIEAGKAFQFKEVNHAIIYGLGREKAGMLGGNPNNERDDGCTGVDVGHGAVEGGELSYDDTTEPDNRDDDTVACEWGARGVPANYKAAAKKHLVTGMAAVNSTADARAAILAGRAVTVASDIDYMDRRGNFVRDANGACKRGGHRWPHQMCYTGYTDDLNGQGPHFLQDQSWGATQPGGQIGPIEIASYSFWVSEADAAAQIGQKDSWVFAGVEGFEAVLLHWLM
jgi:hypothetical protein